jgi:hypothetical protein
MSDPVRSAVVNTEGVVENIVEVQEGSGWHPGGGGGGGASGSGGSAGTFSNTAYSASPLLASVGGAGGAGRVVIAVWG